MTPAAGAGRRTGRRSGNPQTREAILTAARALFAQKGFRATSIRSVAAEAGVDPALVHHYFGTKEQLFLAGVQVAVDIPTTVAGVLEAEQGRIGEALVRAILQAWDSEARPSLLGAFRQALTDPSASRMMSEFLGSQVLAQVAATLPYPPAESTRRAGLAASQIIGMVTARYLLVLPPLATMTAEEVVSSIGPAIQQYLTG
ncbi:TetR/AcrR family transcriptional regulator [Nakamurella silvestris]|nr:TetR/AcrR family transcriptional regulator [Nakamurella silvestris]